MSVAFLVVICILLPKVNSAGISNESGQVPRTMESKEDPWKYLLSIFKPNLLLNGISMQDEDYKSAFPIDLFLEYYFSSATPDVRKHDSLSFPASVSEKHYQLPITSFMQERHLPHFVSQRHHQHLVLPTNPQQQYESPAYSPVQEHYQSLELSEVQKNNQVHPGNAEVNYQTLVPSPMKKHSLPLLHSETQKHNHNLVRPAKEEEQHYQSLVPYPMQENYRSLDLSQQQKHNQDLVQLANAEENYRSSYPSRVQEYHQSVVISEGQKHNQDLAQLANAEVNYKPPVPSRMQECDQSLVLPENQKHNQDLIQLANAEGNDKPPVPSRMQEYYLSPVLPEGLKQNQLLDILPKAKERYESSPVQENKSLVLLQLYQCLTSPCMKVSSQNKIPNKRIHEDSEDDKDCEAIDDNKDNVQGNSKSNTASFQVGSLIKSRIGELVPTEESSHVTEQSHPKKKHKFFNKVKKGLAKAMKKLKNTIKNFLE